MPDRPRRVDTGQRLAGSLRVTLWRGPLAISYPAERPTGIGRLGPSGVQGRRTGTGVSAQPGWLRHVIARPPVGSRLVVTLASRTFARPRAWLGLDRIATTWLTPAVIIAAAVISRLPTLGFPILEGNLWRQTQTAFTATIFAEEGIDLLHPQVPVLGPPFVMTLEFPLYQAVAALLMDLGISTEVALRGLSLACFAATAAVLWLLLARHVNARTALIGLLIFCFSPLAILWSRTSTIEYPALLGSLLFMLGALEWHAGRGRRWFVVATVAGSLAALIKVTTAVFWVAPALLTRRRTALLLCAVPAVLAVAWSVYAEAERAGLPVQAGLAGSPLVEWVIGGDRLDPLTWARLFVVLELLTSALLLPLAILVIDRSERLIWAWFAVATVGPLLLFTNLYFENDYYAVAVSPAVAALIAGGIDALMRRFGRRSVIVAGGVVVTAAIALSTMSGYWMQAYRPTDPGGVLERAAILRATTAPDELVELGCASWNPAIMFYADRRGMAMTGDGTLTVVDDPRVCLAGEKVGVAPRVADR
jgi:Dolichyl-phosphate-mannose-protein mannosyltransferase